MERETNHLEYKEKKTSSFLKTVSAFANYSDGRIVFGISDDGRIVGIEDPVGLCHDIENMINDSLNPVPEFQLEIDDKNKLVVVHVYEGVDKPYCYKNKAYKRSDSSTVAVTRLEFSRLILEGQNKDYEELDSKRDDLKFGKLDKELREKIQLDRFDTDTLRTLELLGGNRKYNHAAELLADNNEVKILDMVRFGNDMDEITERVEVRNTSVLSAYEEAMEVFSRYYIVEKITGGRRERVELIPEKAFREAIANAIVHRIWDVDQSIQVGMHRDKIEITSPGGLPADISQEEYLKGRVSVLRNPILAGVFARLGIIEKFGTGIRRINACYKTSVTKPEYEFFENSITVILPVLTDNYNLDSAEEKLVEILSPSKIMSREELEKQSGMDKSKVIRVLNSLIEKRVVQKIGSGRGTRYSLKS